MTLAFPRVLHFIVICLKNPTTVLKHPGIIEQQSTQASEQGGRMEGEEGMQVKHPVMGFSVLSRDQAVHCYWVSVGPRLTLTAFVLC